MAPKKAKKGRKAKVAKGKGGDQQDEATTPESRKEPVLPTLGGSDQERDREKDETEKGNNNTGGRLGWRRGRKKSVSYLGTPKQLQQA